MLLLRSQQTRIISLKYYAVQFVFNKPRNISYISIICCCSSLKKPIHTIYQYNVVASFSKTTYRPIGRGSGKILKFDIAIYNIICCCFVLKNSSNISNIICCCFFKLKKSRNSLYQSMICYRSFVLNRHAIYNYNIICSQASFSTNHAIYDISV
jgi:hypothetical protein